MRRGGKHFGEDIICCCAHTVGVPCGTPLSRLHTPAAEDARSLLVVLRRGSLTAAEDSTGHTYQTMATWMRRARRPRR
jgi:hypothetical protein